MIFQPSLPGPVPLRLCLSIYFVFICNFYRLPQRTMLSPRLMQFSPSFKITPSSYSFFQKDRNNTSQSMVPISCIMITGMFQKIQTFGLLISPNESEYVHMKPRNQHSNMFPKWFLLILKFDDPCVYTYIKTSFSLEQMISSNF